MFRVCVDVILFGLKYQLNQINVCLNRRDTIRIGNVEYCRSSIDSDGHVGLTQTEFRNDDVRIMFSLFGQYSSNGPMI